jgi:hypothetical protein
MATHAEGLRGALPARLPAPVRARVLAARRSLRDLRPGLALAVVFAWGLGMARFIDVSEDGKAMLVFGTTFFVAITSSAVFRPPF